MSNITRKRHRKNEVVVHNATPLLKDADNDGLGLFDEYRYCTSPFTPDTDGDGVWDGVEVPHSPGSCPCDASDEGSPANCVTLILTVGDPSGSNSERWNLEVFEEATGRAVVCHCDDGFGTPGSAEYALVKGKTYTFRLKWIATNLGYGPDYDWQAKINGSTAEGAREGLYGTGAFIVEDPDRLLTDEKHGNETDITIGKQGRIIVPKVDLKIDNVSEDDEESVGGFVPVNADNDNGSAVTYHIPATRDFDANGYTDDDLVPVSLRLEPATGLSGTLRLRKVEGGRDRIRVWETAGKVAEVTLPKTWTVGADAIPATLQVEGLKEGAALRDVALVLEYLQDGTVICGDTVKVTVTPVLKTLKVVDSGTVPALAVDGSMAIFCNDGLDQGGVPAVQFEIEVFDVGNPLGELCMIHHARLSNLLAGGAGVIGHGGIHKKLDFIAPHTGGELVDADTKFPFYDDLDGTAATYMSNDTPGILVEPPFIWPQANGDISQIDVKCSFKMYGVWQFSDAEGTVYFLGNADWSARIQGQLQMAGGVRSFVAGANNDNVGSTGFVRSNVNARTVPPDAAGSTEYMDP